MRRRKHIFQRQKGTVIQKQYSVEQHTPKIAFLSYLFRFLTFVRLLPQNLRIWIRKHLQGPQGNSANSLMSNRFGKHDVHQFLPVLRQLLFLTLVTLIVLRILYLSTRAFKIFAP